MEKLAYYSSLLTNIMSSILTLGMKDNITIITSQRPYRCRLSNTCPSLRARMSCRNTAMFFLVIACIIVGHTRPVSSSIFPSGLSGIASSLRSDHVKNVRFDASSHGEWNAEKKMRRVVTVVVILVVRIKKRTVAVAVAVAVPVTVSVAVTMAV